MTRRTNAILGFTGGALIAAGAAILYAAGATDLAGVLAIIAVALGGLAIGYRR